jgi:hypothetical protein
LVYWFLKGEMPALQRTAPWQDLKAGIGLVFALNPYTKTSQLLGL